MIYSKHLKSVEAIAQRFVESLPKSERDYLRTTPNDPFGIMGRYIRNEFKLWDPNHPLTAHWHLHPDAREIIDGIDCSPDHPDAVSAEILAHARKLV
jgi:hypothetical protein